MNVPYNQMSAMDASKIIGVDYTTVLGWCKRGIIDYSNISEGTEKARYLVYEDDVDALKQLVKEYGTRKALLHWKKRDNAHMDTKPVAKLTEPIVKSVVVNITKEDDIPTRKPFNMDNIIATISYIQDIKERLNDIEAEKNQLMNELEELRKEVMEQL